MKATSVVITLLATTAIAAAPRPAAELTPAAVRRSVNLALPLVARTGPATFKKSGCVSCHNQSLPAMTMALARERGFTVDEAAAGELLRTSVAAMSLDSETRLQMGEVLGATITIGYALLGLQAEDYPADMMTDSLALWTARTQYPDGSWREWAERPPMEYSEFTATALAMRSLQLYGPPAKREEFESRIERARDWLATHPARDNEARTFRLLGLGWADAPDKVLREAAADLTGSQNPDGGWSQLPGLPSDPYATGQALYALGAVGGVGADHPAYQRGAAYLLGSQLDDGSWRVRSRSIPLQSYFESGFPHGPDQWISAAATSWATMALTLTVEPKSD